MLSTVSFRPFNGWLIFYTALYSFSTVSTIFCLLIIVSRMLARRRLASGQLFFGAMFVASLIPFHIIHGIVIVLKKLIVLPPATPGSSSIFRSVSESLLADPFDSYIVSILILFCDNLDLICISNCVATGMFFFMNLVVGIRSGVRPYPTWLTKVIHDRRAVLACVAFNLAVLVVTVAIDRFAYLSIYVLNAFLEIISILILAIFIWTISVTLYEMRNIVYKRRDSGKSNKLKSNITNNNNNNSKTAGKSGNGASSSQVRAYNALVRVLITAIALFIIMAFALYAKYIANFLSGTPFPYALEPALPAGFNFSYIVFAIPGPFMILVFYNNGSNGSNNNASTNNNSVNSKQPDNSAINNESSLNSSTFDRLEPASFPSNTNNIKGLVVLASKAW